MALRRGKRNLKLQVSDEAPAPVTPPRNLDKRTTITIDEKTFVVEADDLETLCVLGRGAYGIVDKMRHKQSGTIMAVKRIAATVNTQEQKRLLMDLDISMRSSACPYTVQFYGALFREGDVWICMEVMDMSLDKFYTKVYKHSRAIPEDILGKVAFAPERIDPSGNPSQYDIRSDVWSLGISLVELATGKFPYESWGTPFEQLKQVVKDEAPKLPVGKFSPSFEEFINKCLMKNYTARPNYSQLLELDFIREYAQKDTNVAEFVEEILDLPENEQPV
ncbi:Dual specificity mitogen-activated protein kinase kinase 6 [Acromyrmex echinatior]|uniref:mitogen-activated protein kinase kinase n=1 Tax=Acromyrmex echinatior TaxID=103372 RepID=F4WEX8_ACREC|nr:Dual specificity mitogen-activated protein kinase kinase 6 [Acromyrmex echinatior]